MKQPLVLLMIAAIFIFKGTKSQYACNSSPCLNTAVCYNSAMGNKFLCLCIDGYAGIQCEISLSGTCPDNYVCVNGTCLTDLMGNPHCACDVGYSGSKCEIPPEEPESRPMPICITDSPCQHGGICFTSANNPTLYLCECVNGYTGPNCTMLAELKDPCNPNPCINTGNCTLHMEIPSGYRCLCPMYFSGQNCSIDDTIGCTFDGMEFSNRNVRTVDCNTCTCVDGTWVCTEKSCGSFCPYGDMIYMDSDVREADCNTCMCIHGEWLCTQYDCSSVNSCDFGGVVYSKEHYRREECNICYCLEGQWACTSKDCLKIILIEIIFHLNGDYSIVNPTELFKEILNVDLSQRFSVSGDNMIENIKLSAGSIQVTFDLVGSEDGTVDVMKVSSDMQQTIDVGNYFFTFNGITYQSVPDSFTSEVIWQNQTDDEGIGGVVILIAIGSCGAVGLFIIILGVILYIKTSNTKRRHTKYDNQQLPNKRTGLDGNDHSKTTMKTRANTLPTNLHM